MTTETELEKYHIDDRFVIEDVETLKVLADPLRLRLIQALGDKPHTVKQISKLLSIPPNKLYYHVNLLEEHGIIRVVETRIVSGIIEKIYLLTARTYSPAPGLLSPAAQENDSNLLLMVDGIFEETKQTLLESFRAGLVTLEGENTESEEDHILSHLMSMRVNLTEAQVREFASRLRTLVDEYCELDEQNSDHDDSVQPYRLLMTFFPTLKMSDSPEEDEP
ncbi:MAG: helix-turn-helix domain-containing protein [Anaerolineae bacterium]|nr:helix-turn-helix domain-containing protein [Anaerolineae bacterium]